RTPVPAVDQSRGITPPAPAGQAHRNIPPIREPPLRIVARRAGDRLVARKAAIEEQPLPHLDLFRGQRILLRHGHIQIQSQRNRDRGSYQSQHYLLADVVGRKSSSTQTSCFRGRFSEAAYTIRRPSGCTLNKGGTPSSLTGT